MATYRPETESNTLLADDSILEYVLETTVYPREHERLRELRLITQQPIALPAHIYTYIWSDMHRPSGLSSICVAARLSRSFMRSSPDQMQFFSVLLKLVGASNTIEVGVFTGYSLLTAALALPAGGKVHSVSLVSFFHAQTTPPGHPDIYQPERTYVQVVAIDANREYYELGRPVIEEAGVAHKVDFREGDGITELDEILSEDGGAMAGAMPGSSEYDRLVRDSLVGFNAAVAADDRVEACIVPIADGVTLCRRVK
ncbi:hypothetical protein ZWY2020_059693 [Hordeum vulgare]|nr:hypothetical protein ZWY2020_059693 [Hordeum vulgare]